MDKDSAVRQVARKEINWYGSVGVSAGVDSVNVLARVENVKPHLLENSVLRIDILIRLFVVVPEKNLEVGAGPGQKKIVKDIEISSFIQLRNVHDTTSIVSLHHDISVDRVSVRMGRVSAVGTLNLEVVYLGYVILEGKVSEFLRNDPVRDAQVTVKDNQSGAELISATTDRDGRYVINELGPGTYRVKANAEGFASDEQVAVVMLRDEVNFVLHRI